MEVTLNYNKDGESFAFQFVFSTGRNWVFRYSDSTRKLESLKATVSMDVCIRDEKQIRDFFLKATSPSKIRFVNVLMNEDFDLLCKGMMHIEKSEMLAFVSDFGKSVDKCMYGFTGIVIAKYVGGSVKKTGLCNGMLYPVICENGDSCLVLSNGNTVSVSNNNLQFTI